jgi:antitoxin component YwqK of YwqJK toxin-antitoxin module
MNSTKYKNCEAWYNNGQLQWKSTRIREIDIGLCEYWYENGKLYERFTKNNYGLHGLYETWYDNGQIWCRRTYVNNQLEGLYEEWYNDGTLKLSYIYEKGKHIETLSSTKLPHNNPTPTTSHKN